MEGSSVPSAWGVVGIWMAGNCQERKKKKGGGAVRGTEVGYLILEIVYLPMRCLLF